MELHDVLSSNQSILVQVVKEPISTKGPRISFLLPEDLLF
jgi:ribonuclease G